MGDQSGIDAGLWTEVGQNSGDGVWVTGMEVVCCSSSCHDGQTQLNQAASKGGLLLHQLEDMEREIMNLHLQMFVMLR